MQIYLIRDLAGKGKAGQIINVNDGYGRNFIIKNGYGRVADNAVTSQVKSKTESENFHRAEEIKRITGTIETLKSISIVIPAKVGAGGKMFGGITGEQVSAELLKSGGIAIDKKSFIFEPIKTAGEYIIKVKFPYSLSGEFRLEVRG
jgi:large subunit ribosomal protein L9